MPCTFIIPPLSCLCACYCRQQRLKELNKILEKANVKFLRKEYIGITFLFYIWMYLKYTFCAFREATLTGLTLAELKINNSLWEIHKEDEWRRRYSTQFLKILMRWRAEMETSRMWFIVTSLFLNQKLLLL